MDNVTLFKIEVLEQIIKLTDFIKKSSEILYTSLKNINPTTEELVKMRNIYLFQLKKINENAENIKNQAMGISENYLFADDAEEIERFFETLKNQADGLNIIANEINLSEYFINSKGILNTLEAENE